MGLLQAAYRTYENQASIAGILVDQQETLIPISHILQNAHIEITLRDDGVFQDAKPVPKAEAKTIIPANEESANRVGDNDKAHLLCDQLRYVSAYGGTKYEAYLAGLTQWAQSEYSHPKVRAVLRYIQGGTILNDLSVAGIVTLDADGKPAGGKIEGTEYGKCLIRWRIVPAPDGVSSACWEDPTLFRSFIDYYSALRIQGAQDFCSISGSREVPAQFHPKGVIAANYGAKLISANDSSGFTYRGRFTEARQSGTIGYTASQKAHSALRWIAANHGVVMGGRTFLWWNPEGKKLPSLGFLGMEPDQEQRSTFTSYKEQLRQTLGGYRMTLTARDDVVVAALDAATTGRLSVAYYNELQATDFLDRLQNWYETCNWDTRYYGMMSPSIKRIALCACGSQRGNFIDADSRVFREYVQRLLHCILDRKPIPADIVQSLTAKASRPLSYTPYNREAVLYTACAIVRKYRNDIENKEVWTLALAENNDDRSYLYGRLLAIAEHVERSTYDNQEGREPNAIRMQSVFSQRPQYAWRILHEALEPYFKRLNPGLRQYYRGMISEICDKLSPYDAELNQKLKDIYLLGYYHQRAALFKKKNANAVMEETENESAEK